MNKKMLVSKAMFKKYENAAFNHDQILNSSYENIINDYNLPWLKLKIKIPYDVILNEIVKIQHLFVKHRDEHNDHEGWMSFCIHGKSYDATREDEHYNDDRNHIWTKEAIENLPNTIKFFKEIWPNKNFRRLRVMLLKPNGYISIHKDSSVHGLSPINVAINQPKNCKFVMEKYGTVPFNKGDAFMLDTANNHTVFNNSDENRYHIIVHHGIIGDSFKNLVIESYNSRLLNW
jgi:hypothetical protein